MLLRALASLAKTSVALTLLVTSYQREFQGAATLLICTQGWLKTAQIPTSLCTLTEGSPSEPLPFSTERHWAAHASQGLAGHSS